MSRVRSLIRNSALAGGEHTVETASPHRRYRPLQDANRVDVVAMVGKVVARPIVVGHGSKNFDTSAWP